MKLFKPLTLLIILLLMGWITLSPAYAESTIIKFLDETHGQEPWITDLTPKGTHLLKDIDKGTSSSFGAFGEDDQSVSLFGYQYFIASHSIYRTDGTAKRTQVEGNINEMLINNLVKYNNKLFFTLSDHPSLYRVFPRGEAISSSIMLTFDQSKAEREIIAIEAGVFDNKMLLLIQNYNRQNNKRSYDLRLSNGQKNWSKILKYRFDPSNKVAKRLTKLFVTDRNIYFLEGVENEIWMLKNTSQAPQIAQLTKFNLPKDVDLNPETVLADKNYLYFGSHKGDIYRTDGSQKRTRKISSEKPKNEHHFRFIKLFKNHLIVHAIKGTRFSNINAIYKIHLSTGKWSKLLENSTSREITI